MKKTAILTAVLSFAFLLSACGSSDGDKKTNTTGTDTYPITLHHAFGETVIERKPEKVAAISWGNQDVPLALGVIPVGTSKANYGVQGPEGLLPWTVDRYKELGVSQPVVFDDTDSLDYEAISNTDPDVILASYSGITKEEYDILSKIAPVVAYEKKPWQTLWREQTLQDAAGMGMGEEGKQLVKDLDKLIKDKVSNYPDLKGKTAAFAYFNPSDLGNFYIYLPEDPRAAYLTDLGLEFPEEIRKLSTDSTSFSIQLSAEHADVLNNVDILVAYGNDDLLKAMQKDRLLGSIPAVKRGSLALFEDGSALAASATPTVLSIPATIDDYLSVIGKAAEQVQ